MKKLFVLLIGSAVSFFCVSAETSDIVVSKDNYSYCQGMTSNSHAWCYASKGIVIAKETPEIFAVPQSGENKSVWQIYSK